MLALGLTLAWAGGDAHAAKPAKPGKPAARKAPPPPPLPPRANPASRAALHGLRDGSAAFLAGDYQGARQHLLPLAKASLTLYNRDYALFLLAESEALLGAEANDAELLGAARARFLLVAGMAGSRFQSTARGRATDCQARLYALLPSAAARAPLLTALNGAITLSKTTELDTAALRYKLATLYQQQQAPGDAAEARALLRKLYIEHPAHPLAEPALAELQALDQALRDTDRGAPRFAISAAERIARARTLTLGRRWQDALVELGRIKEDLSQTLRDDVDYWTGTTFFRMRRRYDEAGRKLLQVATRLSGERQAEAMFHGARALSRADLDDEAVKRYQELVAAHPGSRYAAEASFLTGWLEYNRGRYAEAIKLLGVTAQRFPGRFGEEARWYAAWSRYLSGDLVGATAELQTLAQRAPRGAQGEKALYWAGRALLLQGKLPEAEATLRRVAVERPLSYYSQLARLRLRELAARAAEKDGKEARPLPPLFAPGASPPSFAPLQPLEARLSGDPQIVRVDELLAAALPIEASFELRRGEGALLTRYGAPRALPLLFDRYRRGMNFMRPHLLAESHGAAALQRDPHSDPAARAYWEQVYPLAYQALVEKYGPSGQSPPRYLYTIMQKESAYNPHDVSYADAIGLLQMIPPTSQRVAAHIGRPYTDDVLYDPDGNIQFGAWYIGHLLRKFKGQIALGAGSFNAGPKAMLRWLALHGDRPLDEFIELCAYTQTREYMKKVLDIYAHYVYLWDKEEYVPSLQIDKASLSNDGIDY